MCFLMNMRGHLNAVSRSPQVYVTQKELPHSKELSRILLFITTQEPENKEPWRFMIITSGSIPLIGLKREDLAC